MRVVWSSALKRELWIKRLSLRVYSTKVPDNAPRAADNEVWLETLRPIIPSSQEKQSPDGNSSRKNFIKVPLSEVTSINYLQRYNKHKHNQGNFVDVRIVKCRSGAGGSGAVSFFRDAGRSIGPPDGGDGGAGGSVYVQAVVGLGSLAKMKTTYIAEDGESGAARQLDGMRGKDVLIQVPVGTVVKWCLPPQNVRELVEREMCKDKNTTLRSVLSSTPISLSVSSNAHQKKIQLYRRKVAECWLFKDKSQEYHENKDWFKNLHKKMEAYDHSLQQSELFNDHFPLTGLDLEQPTAKPICLLKGGQGGLGNMHFLTNLIRNPRFSKPGRNGLEQYFLFELKSIADLGLIGLPNAGKSTILNRISNARPKIGHWQFTTLNPTIGTVSLGFGQNVFTVADIPGIIEGASLDKGMGLEFLRHIERSKGWVFVVNLANANPLNELHLLIEEVGSLEKVKTKNILIVCNKADVDFENPDSIAKYLEVEQFSKIQGWDCVPISALKGENIDVLKQKMFQCARQSKTDR
ncbi:hypothetical protein SMKI_08G2110 [Saccharomyces mikatae IFO 1815]|uniref:Mtg2p n=1 Tax=Saccharomyces mikatae IFO 1815 TaxID=226126 RepID=A0AA35NI20_SACMI|nr:uncharacterized protein SMKI_08G2110 [Saccharomyces mikatae IFO 1815]CAI4039543.1 hypothetical protein SMKI_08G2110 [Saccharomyces mikatae IFO 1815]